MKNILISVDTGKSTTKVVTKIVNNIQKFAFRTKVQEVSCLGADLSHNSYNVDFQGKSYLIGDMVSESSCNFQINKNTIEHQLCIYISICKIIEKLNAMSTGVPNICLAINAPLNIYKNNSLKEAYRNFIQNNGNIISIKVNNKVYLFKITSIIVLPEAIGPIFVRSGDFRNKKVTLIDIGSLNINYCTFNKLVPELDSMNIANLGINVLRGKIAEKLTERYGLLISDSDVEQILSNDQYLYIAGVKQADSKEIIDKLINNHISNIFNYGRSRGLTFNNSNLVFCGGGALLLKENLLSQYQLAIIEKDPQFSNCLSFFNILEVKYEN
ncbi:ParM/StbA family protein [Clostridium sp. JS66]|uniref:ParM/StbA family protein n=1 Tax=Clostridium sp. JS66 TaxID=3064705 RepID=UPI00298DD05D|nr:ParM/StbA family protein [Clostridium sp. JS66]WPC42823.1 ParM/StbA family protein [Clostridium sp. JS66]